jgi:multicomponent K+:H+ antiporter subunit A
MSTLLFRQVARVVFPVALVFALHLLLRGHDRPGGGFIAGLVVTTTLVLEALAFGAEAARRRYTQVLRPATALGLAIAALAGLVGLLWGDPTFSFEHAKLDVPGMGKVGVSTTLIFDLGVFLVIIGSTTAFLAVFFRPVPPRRARAGAGQGEGP